MATSSLITTFNVTSSIPTNATSTPMSTASTIEANVTVFSDVISSAVTIAKPRVSARRLTLDDILNQYTEYTISRGLGIYGYPIIVFLGTLGNILTFLIMIKPDNRKTSTYFYMAALAVFDTLVLYVAGFRQWLALLQGSDALTLSPAACKIFNFLSYTCFDVAVWILVAMTIERFIAVHFPLKAPKIATIPRARKVVLLLIAIFTLVNVHFFWTVTIDERGRCNYLENFEYFHDTIWPWVDAVIYSFLPFILLLVFNILIIYDSRKALSFRRSTSLYANGKKNTNINTGLQLRLSAMLVTVSLVFLLLSSPNVVLISIRHIYFDFSLKVEDFRDVAVYSLVSTVTNICIYLNHAVNFVLYCISGQRFRKQLWQLITCKWTQQQIRASTFSDARTRTRRFSESSPATSPSSYRREMENYI